MLDRAALRLLKPAHDAMARALVRAGVGADAVTFAGFALSIAGALAVASHAPLPGLALVAAGRWCDGLDGAVARLTRPTDRGAFLDIVLDFVFYASVPLAFAWADPLHNALPAAVLLFAFMGTASSSLAFSALAARRGLASDAYPNKGLYYLGGLTEGTETLLCFAAMMLWPAAFPLLALGFAALCALTFCTRLVVAWRLLGHEVKR